MGISVVPQKWIFIKDNKNCCYWPNVNNVRKYIKHASQHQDDWDSWPVKVFLNEPVSYCDALEVEKSKEMGTESEKTLEDCSRSGRKRKAARDPNFVSNDESFEGNVLIEPLPKIIIQNNEAQQQETISEHSFASTLSVNSVDLMPPPDLPVPLSFTQVLPTVDNHFERPELPNVEIENAEILYEFENNNMTTVDHTIKNKLDQIIRTTQSNKILLERLLKRFDSPDHQQYLTPISQTIQDSIPKTAFKKFTDLLQFDQQIKESEAIRKQMETIFYISGGSSYYDNIRRGLRKIFSDKLARKCSWLGRKNNYQISNLKIIEQLRNAARKNFPTLSDQAFEMVVSNWFRQANVRYTRTRKRDIKGNI